MVLVQYYFTTDIWLIVNLTLDICQNSKKVLLLYNEAYKNSYQYWHWLFMGGKTSDITISLEKHHHYSISTSNNPIIHKYLKSIVKSIL